MAVSVGAKVDGKVTGITNFGAFVDLGAGQTGLVHISEISDSFVKDIHDVLSVGDTVTVKVMSEKDGKIGLSIRKATDHPAGANEHHQSERHEGSRPQGGQRPHSNGGSRHEGARPQHHGYDNGHGGHGEDKPDDFDSMLSGFLKDSEQRLSTLRHNTEGKRGGRGGRRS
ncbi:S1 domain-containing RNA-binding protein [Lacticaseibacillus zhaodongensis]|uniref:S1 domain-containing RNA-binding protein n=1 Tax=Lacticaseibacillus zhaodongensis TaxID=2668065 RepID=UPI0012D2E9EB|nr:S1 domain-containing RNA-binding protein [Lacticaseibacillus zhaodongensis]